MAGSTTVDWTFMYVLLQGLGMFTDRRALLQRQVPATSYKVIGS